MKIGFIGLGKLGLPCAVAIAAKGHQVLGYDLNPQAMSKNRPAYNEKGPDGVSDFFEHLQSSSIEFAPLTEVCENSEIIFVAVQTPHEARFEGITPLSSERKDFDYSFLVEALEQINSKIKKETVVVIISTVLPGTIREKIIPWLNPFIRLCYNPFFIAMGTTMYDFLNPEFILFGSDNPENLNKVKDFYNTLNQAPFYQTTIENAELIKVAYNTFIGMKVAFANTLMEICHKTPNTDVDSVTKALGLANKRLLSDKYLYGGMGDGGGCHPRDNIALSWLSDKLSLSYDWFHNLMLAREKQTEWLADLLCSFDLPKAILGYSFKAETNITTGSPAILLKNILKERGIETKLIDPIVENKNINIENFAPHVFLIGAKHSVFSNYKFPQGSVVIDPWRYIPKTQEGIKVISLGIGPSQNLVEKLVSVTERDLKNAEKLVKCLGSTSDHMNKKQDEGLLSSMMWK